jgi:hypothetical protein
MAQSRFVGCDLPKEGRQAGGQAGRQAGGQAGGWAEGRRAGRWAGGQAGGQGAGGQVGREKAGRRAGCSVKSVTQELNDKLCASRFLAHSSAVGYVFVLVAGM